ncbi:uncharacterized protein V6R79_009340 [Siganus canaliculatus]
MQRLEDGNSERERMLLMQRPLNVSPGETSPAAAVKYSHSGATSILCPRNKESLEMHQQAEVQFPSSPDSEQRDRSSREHGGCSKHTTSSSRFLLLEEQRSLPNRTHLFCHMASRLKAADDVDLR